MSHDDETAEAVLRLVMALRDYRWEDLGRAEPEWDGGLKGPQYDGPEVHFGESA